MKKQKKLLTESEEQLMEILWSNDKPMTSIDLAEYSVESDWKSSYVYIMIRSLLKKGMIRECGTIQYHTQYARQFRPAITKEEYAAKLTMSLDLDRHSITKVAVALIEEISSDSDDVIQELEAMIQSLRK